MRFFPKGGKHGPPAIAVVGLVVGLGFVGAGYLIGLHRGASAPTNPWALPVYLASRGAARLTGTEPGKDGLTRLHLIETDNGKRFNAWGLPGKAHLVMLMGDVFDEHGVDVTPGPKGARPSQAAPLTRGGENQGTASNGPVDGGRPGGRSVAAAGPQQIHASRAAAGGSALAAVKISQASRLIWGSIGVTHGFVTRNGRASKTRPVIQVFFDANCPYCHELYTRLSRLRDVSIRWIPVAVLKKSSLGRGAAILAGGAPALSKDESGFDVASETGAITPVDNATERRLVAVNTMVLASASNPVFVPAIVWRTQDGAHHLRFGVPDASELASIIHKARPERGRGS